MKQCKQRDNEMEKKLCKCFVFFIYATTKTTTAQTKCKNEHNHTTLNENTLQWEIKHTPIQTNQTHDNTKLECKNKCKCH